ncbi:unnamed protein product [Paramecium sonneborni]|uniref:Thioredoxin reductase n=1 Tax=Paramecium sonneborni TaxID=65129 RepID=A0A8S1RWH0_9CILI|nr:unnamed protein product [Paramecium sonneborni]
MNPQYQYDIFVIGGGSGGLTVVDEAQMLGKRVGLADYIKPSPHGTQWGTGGTCPNVGCIPKKLMHMTALIGEIRHELTATGWQGIDPHSNHDWNTLVNEVQRQVKGINKANDDWLVTTNGITYYNKLGKLKDDHTIELIDKDGQSGFVTAEYIVIAVGSRPSFPNDIPNVKQLTITSDDLFSLKKAPGKTLVVGASYVALECAGFLTGLGYDVTVMVRSILLRGFDQEMAERIGEFMKIQGTKFIRGTIPNSIEDVEGKRLVKWLLNGQEQSDVYDTVLLAIGRSADTQNLGLEQVGVQTNKESGKIIANESDLTSVPNIFAIGDCVQGRLELTPTAIMCGKRLIKRLYSNGNQVMEYSDVSTTVFTPLEYGCVGYSEEAAVKKFGRENLKIFTSEFTPLFWNFANRKGTCYAKLIVKKDDDIVIGFHYLGPDAAEVTQGFGVVIKLKAKKNDLDNVVGIHPSVAEEIVQMQTWK